jgi:hypothetical protein
MKKRIFFTMLCLFVAVAIISCSGSANQVTDGENLGSNGGDPAKQLTDKEILVKIFESTNGPNWKASDAANWLSEKPIGEWEGVTTNDEGRVIALRIAGDKVSGIFPAEMGGLTALEQLFIFARDCEAPNVIPAEIGKLTKLNNLSLTVQSKPKMDKPVLPDLSTLIDLKKLYIKGFGGTIPENISQLSKLQILGLHGYEGKIPESICKLSELTELAIYMPNQPMNGLPDCIGKLSRLTLLKIDFSSGFTVERKEPNGKFPESIWDLTNLEYLTMNALSNTGGPIPGDKVAKMANLKSVTIANCGITGIIPAEMFTAGKLIGLGIYQNNLTGSIPAEIGKCLNLATLRLNQNQLTGKIPAELAKCVKLTVCDLSNNQLSPDIPAALKAHPKFGNFKF